MKRILISLMMAGGLAMLAAPYANATAIGECGKTYAILLTGAQESTSRATGAAGEPGALTVANGVGTITFGAAGTNGPTGCTVTGGELIFNSGDVQTSPAGLFIGPAHCYDSVSALGTGLPCFDGGVHMSGTIAPSANDGNSLQLSIIANYAWVDTNIMSGAVPLGFTVQNNTGAAIVTGASNPGPSGTNPTGQVLTLEMQKIGTSTNSTPTVPTAFGTAPYLGDSTISCQAWGANDTDFVAALNDAAPAVSGAYQSTIGALQIFPTGQAGGSLSFNGNDNYGSTAVPNSNNDCSFTDVPGFECAAAIPGCAPVPAAYGFADGTSNSIAFVGPTGNDCGDADVAGAGYATSAVVYGTTYTSNYITVTGLFSAATGFVPPGGESFCQGFSSAPAGYLHLSSVPPTQVLTGPYPQTKTTPVTATSTTPADCDIEATLTPVSGAHAQCSAALSLGTTDANGGTVSVVDGVNCTCTTKISTGETDTYTLSYSSISCPISVGAGPITYTCKN